ncbi:MAG: cysteine desulfurase [Proteobacteria bacterium]|nr:cysteine desulfurase [Pseudomonadota bacterium]
MSAVYLDCNATAPVRPEAAEAVARALMSAGNPSSVHKAGRGARATLEAARMQVAALVGGSPARTVFTGGGTEANALAVSSAVAAGSRRLLISSCEHDCVRQAAAVSGAAVEVWPVDAEGRADLRWLTDRLNRWDRAADGPPFAALMLANNETGVIQPVHVASGVLHTWGGRLHIDAVQAAGKIPVDMAELGADTLALSAHKLGGPQGVGALIYAAGVPITRASHGGGQEKGLRAGTENVPGAAGFGAGAEAARRGFSKLEAQSEWRDEAARRLVETADVTILGEASKRLPQTLCFAAPGFEAERQLMVLDLEDVMVGAGSACSSGKVTPSHVLTAMGLDGLAGSALRVSGGWNTTRADWVRFTDVWLDAWARWKARRAT